VAFTPVGAKLPFSNHADEGVGEAAMKIALFILLSAVLATPFVAALAASGVNP
jgi:hypothetical protein